MRVDRPRALRDRKGYVSTPRVPRDCYLYLWYLCARYVSLAPISSMMRTKRVVLMHGEAGQEAVLLNMNEIKRLDWKPCTDDLIIGVDDRVWQTVVGRPPGSSVFLSTAGVEEVLSAAAMTDSATRRQGVGDRSRSPSLLHVTIYNLIDDDELGTMADAAFGYAASCNI